MWVIRPGHEMTARSAPLRGMAWSHKLKKKERCVPKVGLAKELRSQRFAAFGVTHLFLLRNLYNPGMATQIVNEITQSNLWPNSWMCESRCASISLKWRLAHFSFPFFFLESRLSNKKTKRNYRAEIQRKRNGKRKVSQMLLGGIVRLWHLAAQLTFCESKNSSLAAIIQRMSQSKFLFLFISVRSGSFLDLAVARR